MKRLLSVLSLALVAMLSGCTAMMESSSYGSSDLYVTDNRIKVAEELKAQAEAERAQAEARKAMWEARLAETEYYNATGENYSTILADDYESAYARRLYGFNSPTYRLPSSYYNLATSDAMRYASAYDPAFYNIMLSGDQVWVEPKYVTSMFGSWGATNVTFGIYASPWVYGWGVHVDPFYYTMWGYPHYSWYDWNWNMCYNPYHWGYYPGYYPGYYHPHYGYPAHGHHPRPPHYRPGGSGKPSGTKPGVVHRESNGRQTATRYTSPTSNTNYGRNLNGSRVGTAIRNNGSTSSGINHSTVRNGNASRGNTRYSTSNSTSTESRSTQSSNFRSSSSSQSNRSSSSSSSYRSSSSSSSSYRSSGGSSSSRSTGGTTSSRR